MKLRTTLIAILSGVPLLLVGGCVKIPKQGGFADVQKSVADRTGQPIRWNQDAAADRDAESAVARLLEPKLTPDSAVQVALLNNRGLQATYEDLGIAQAEVVQAGLLTNPTIGLEVRFPKHAALPYEIDIEQTLIDLLLMPLRKRSAGDAFEAAKMRVTHDVLMTAAEAREAFYRAQAAEQLLELRRTIRQATEAGYDAARRLREAGNITELALANERALYEQAKLELRAAEAEVADTREGLNAVLGLWGNQTAWTIDGRLPDVPAEEVTQQGLESLAVAHRADLAAARHEAESIAQNLGLTRRTALGSDVSLTGHLERDSDGTTTVGPGIRLPLPIFNQGQPAIAAAEARLRQSERRFEALAVKVRVEVRRARARLIAARDRCDYFRAVVLPLRQQIVQETLLHYNAMQVGVFELLQAKKEQINAGREYVEAMRDYWLARVELEKAVSTRLPTAPPAAMPAATQPAAAQPIGADPKPQTRPAESEPHHHH